MITAAQNYTEDYVLEQMLNEENENSNFFGHRWHLKKQAKEDLKNKLRKKHGRFWWLPGKIQKYHREYKSLKHKVIDEALKKASQENFEERESKRKAKAERKDKRTLEMQQKEFNQQMQMQQQIGMQNAQKNIGAGASAEKPKKDNKKIFLYIGIAAFVIIAGIVTAVLIKNNK